MRRTTTSVSRWSRPRDAQHSVSRESHQSVGHERKRHHHTSNADEISEYENNPDFVLLQANDYGEAGCNMVNVAAGANPVLAMTRGMDEPVPMDPLGINADNPLVHLSCRKALAHAFDGDGQG